MDIPLSSLPEGENLLKVLLSCLRRGIRFNLGYKMNRGFYPTFLVYKVTYRCNSRCKTCNIWKEGNDGEELTVEELDYILKNPFWREIKYINVTGGEPFLRSDLIDIMYVIKKNLPRTRLMAISTNGLLVNKIVKDVGSLLSSIFNDKNTLISITVSIDGSETIHNLIRGVPDAYRCAIKTFSELKKMEKDYQNFTVGIETVLSELNIHILEDIYVHNSKLTDHLNFTPSMNAPYYRNENEAPLIRYSPNLIRFFKQMENSCLPLAYYYENVVKYFRTGRRAYPCLGGYKTICMEPNGDIIPCAMLTSVVLGNALKNDLKTIWFGEKARAVRESLKRNPFCKQCLNNCDIINNYSEEFLHFMVFLITRPKMALRIYRSIKRGYGSKYINILR